MQIPAVIGLRCEVQFQLIRDRAQHWRMGAQSSHATLAEGGSRRRRTLVLGLRGVRQLQSEGLGIKAKLGQQSGTSPGALVEDGNWSSGGGGREGGHSCCRCCCCCLIDEEARTDELGARPSQSHREQSEDLVCCSWRSGVRSMSFDHRKLQVVV